MKILIVDDEPSIIRTLRPVLSALGHDVLEAVDAKSALAALGASGIDLVLLDLGLPDADGSDLISTFKKKAEASVIVVSARHMEADKVRSLDQGADDYIDKPFGMEELLARIRVVERRRNEARGKEPKVLQSDLLRVDLKTREVVLMGEPIHLSPKEFAIFETLARNAGQVVTQRRLMIAGWDDPVVDGQYLRSYIGMLRDKLEVDPSDPELIVTESGVGYRLTEPLVQVD